MIKTEFEVPTLKIRKKGMVDTKALLALIKSWFEEEKYGYNETKYSVSAKALAYKAYGEQEINEYVIHRIDVEVSGNELKAFEQIKNQKRHTVYDGKFEIKIGGKMILDPKKRFAGSKFLQFLQDIYHRFILREKIEEVWLDHLLHKIFQLSQEINSLLEKE